MSEIAPKITPFRWFDHDAEAAATFYTSLFSNSGIDEVSRYGPDGRAPRGAVMTASEAMLQMNKLDIAALRAAYAGRSA